jgi:uncharacterized membrane protein YidH (DUF202 family)
MKKEKDYIDDIAEIRSIMERSTKFLSLAGLAGVLAGIYALAGAFIAYRVFNFNPDTVFWTNAGTDNSDTTISSVIYVAVVILLLALSTAVFLSVRRAADRGEKFWNSTTRRLIANAAVPFVTGGLFVVILIFKGMTGLIAPVTLIFYGLSLVGAGKFTYSEVQVLGIIQILLGLAGSCFVEAGLLLWCTGFGLFNIVYGIYMYYKYER